MAISIEDKKRKAIDKRSQAIMSKINMQRTIDGSDIPEIESQGDIDDFNLQMLFGASGDENTDWTQMGPEGLIRAYYNIVEICNGKKRNNNVTNISVSSTTRSSLDAAANLMIDGRGYVSGFYKGWVKGQDGTTIEASDAEKMKGIRGEFEPASSSFNNNRDKNSAGEYPEDSTDILIGTSEPSLTTTGTVSPLHSGGSEQGGAISWADLLTSGFVSDTILGRRYSDAFPYMHTNATQENDATDRYGNGTWDYGDFSWDGDSWEPNTGSNISGYIYINEINYFDSSLYGELDTFINGMDELLLFLNYIKVSDQTFFTTPLIIYDYPDYTNIDSLIDSINTLVSDIAQFKTDMIPYYNVGDSITLNSGRATVNTLINNLVTTLEGADPLFTSIGLAFDASSIYGSPTTAGDLYNIRFLLIKGLINPNDGSKITLKSAASAITSMNNSIVQAEDDFGLYGIIKTGDIWIGGLKLPEIGGIIEYIIPDMSGSVDPDDAEYNENYGESTMQGYMVAWDGTDHATSYNVYKSLDWDGSTGTWVKLLPAGSNFTVEEIDINNGKIINYIIDEEVDAELGEKPYYKVQAYDTGGSGAYIRTGGDSVICDPKNIDDFADTGGGTVPYVGPTGPPPAQPGEIPDYLFKWTTVLYGNQSSDVARKVFKSEALFDSVGSNLEVFVNGMLIEAKDYTILSSSEIELTTAIDLTDRIIMIVYFGNSGSGGGSGVWKDPVADIGLLPTFGNTYGDVRLVLDNGRLYTWSENDRWTDIKIDVDDLDINHNSLNDMADENGINSDHDSRYYTENEVDDFVGDLEVKIDALKYLIPEDATPLSGNLLIQGTIYDGYLSAGEQNYSALSPQQQFSKIVNTGIIDIVLEDSDNQFRAADQGVINLYINDAFIDSFNLATNFNETERSGPQSYTPMSSPSGLIEVTDVRPWNGYSIYQKGSLIIHLHDIYIHNGENSIQIKHEYDGNEYSTENFVFFWNSYTGSIVINSIAVSENAILSNKYLSGVRFYTFGDKFNIAFDAVGTFNNVYSLPSQIHIDSIDFGHTNYDINYLSTGVENVIPTIDRDFIYSSIIDINEENITKSTPILHIYGINIDGDKNIYNSTIQNILINSYSQASTDKAEYFVDEHYRLANDNWDSMPSNTSGVWNSNTILPNNELQVFNHQLQYPKTNYSSYKPTQSINYSTYSGSKSYVRAFIDVGMPHNNGTFYIKGYDPLDTLLHLDIKLPGQTGWLNLETQYNDPDFYGEDGNGCLTLRDEEHFIFTTGEFSSANSGYLILLRVTIDAANTSNIEEISINW